MMRYVTSAMLLIAGIIHLLPLPGALGADRLTTLYGLAFNEPNLVILMRHRAVLFGLVGTLLVVAAFRPELQVIAFVGGLVSVVSFLFLAWSAGPHNAQVGRIVVADIVALACLVVGAGVHFFYLRRTG